MDIFQTIGEFSMLNKSNSSMGTVVFKIISETKHTPRPAVASLNAVAVLAVSKAILGLKSKSSNKLSVSFLILWFFFVRIKSMSFNFSKETIFEINNWWACLCG